MSSHSESEGGGRAGGDAIGTHSARRVRNGRRSCAAGRSKVMDWKEHVDDATGGGGRIQRQAHYRDRLSPPQQPPRCSGMEKELEVLGQVVCGGWGPKWGCVGKRCGIVPQKAVLARK